MNKCLATSLDISSELSGKVLSPRLVSTLKVLAPFSNSFLTSINASSLIALMLESHLDTTLNE